MDQAAQQRISSVLEEVLQERLKQHDKWGEQNLPDGTGPNYLLFGRTETDATNLALRNAAIKVTDSRSMMGILSYSDILLEEVFEALSETDQKLLRAELIQCAAVAVQWVEKIDREAKENGEL